MNEYELREYLNESFVRYVVENYPEIARQWSWMGIQCHTIPMEPNHTCDYYRRKLGLDDNTNTNADNARERD